MLMSDCDLLLLYYMYYENWPLRNRVSYKIDFKAVRCRNGNSDSVGVNNHVIEKFTISEKRNYKVLKKFGFRFISFSDEVSVKVAAF